MTTADEILAVLAEHLECLCDDQCRCDADVRAVHTMAHEIVALRAERDALRRVYDAATKYCGGRTVTREHALIDAVGAVAVQP
jgi:hypothetical protein